MRLCACRLKAPDPGLARPQMTFDPDGVKSATNEPFGKLGLGGNFAGHRILNFAPKSYLDTEMTEDAVRGIFRAMLYANGGSKIAVSTFDGARADLLFASLEDVLPEGVFCAVILFFRGKIGRSCPPLDISESEPTHAATLTTHGCDPRHCSGPVLLILQLAGTILDLTVFEHPRLWLHTLRHSQDSLASC